MLCGWFFGIAAAGFIATGADAQSSPGFGASGTSILGSCNDPSGTGPCHVQFDASTRQRFGGQGQSSTSNTVTYPNAYATISTSQGDLYLPDIHAAVSTSGNARILTQLVTYQTYQFNGATATPFALDLFYHFINSYQGGTADEYPGESFGQTVVSMLLGNPFAAQCNNLAGPSIACGFN